MTEYVILIPGNESTWATASDEDHAAMYAKHMEFAELLARGGQADAARAAYDEAILLCGNDAERTHLEERRACFT